MARLSISRIFETSKLLATEAGKQVADLIDYTSQLGEQTIRALRNGLTFQDNFSCKVSTVSLKHNTTQIVNTDGKQPTSILVAKTSKIDNGIASFGWQINTAGETEVKALFTGAPTATIDVVLLIFFA